MRLPLAITRDCAICFDVSSRISQILSFCTSEYYIAEFLDIVKFVRVLVFYYVGRNKIVLSTIKIPYDRWKQD